MESIVNRNQKARIKTGYRDNQKRMARLSSKREHGAKVLERNVFMAIFGILFGFFTSSRKVINRLFNRGNSENYAREWCSKKPYHYNGEPWTKGITGKRYGVYMREQGRKYKMSQKRAIA
jgi:hypothetical protein